MLFKIVIFLPETTSKYLSILTKNAPERSLINKVFHDSWFSWLIVKYFSIFFNKLSCKKSKIQWNTK